MMLNKLSLNTIGLNRIGLNRIGKPSRGSSVRPYIDPEVLASLKAVCICYGKSNDDPDRAIVKNLVDPDNPFIISNAAYKLNSGFGKYDIDFTIFTNKFNVDSLDAFKVILDGGGSLFRPYSTLTENYPSWKGKVTFNNSNFTGTLTYDYRDNSGKEQKLTITQDGIYQFPICYNTETGDGTFTGLFNRTNSAVTIEQIPSYQGAFVTDGVDDLITSTKTVQEMGIRKACTVISMIHHMDVPSDASFNNIRNSTAVSGRNGVYASGTTGIYGWSKDDVSGTSTTLINNILGDKNNYTNGGGGSAQVDNMKFSVQGFISDSGVISETSQVAWYWTIIANKVLTTDQINQVIAYYNLDRCVEPTVLYDVKRQGLSNDTPDSDWYLKDFSKNGFDMSLFNFAKDEDSGIGKYNYPNWKINVTQGNKYARIVYYDSINGTYSANFKGVTGLYKSYGLSIEIKVNRVSTIDFHSIKEDGIYTMTPPDDTTSIDIRFGGENVYNASCDITITQIPSHAGALCLDGVNDYGQFVGDLGLKDYTVVVDRAYEEAITNAVPILSSIDFRSDIPFLFEFATDVVRPYSFGVVSITNEPLDINRLISYQSTYSYNGKAINKGVSSDIGNGLTFGKFGSENRQYAKLALWSLLLFPYSMSEFLIERQLKKHKLGTLYPDMIELRPIIKGGSIFKYLRVSDNKTLYPGDYINVGDTIRFYVSDISGTPNEVSKFTVNGIEGTPKGNNGDLFDVVVTKSPQKIDITIYQPPQYLTMLSNSTLISNETLIKNE